MGGLYSGSISSRRDRSHGENGCHAPKSDRSAERRCSPSYDSYDHHEPDRRGRSPSPSYDCYDDRRDNLSQRPRRQVSPCDPDSRGALGPTADQEEEDLKMALRLSMQHSPSEPKRSKPKDAAAEGLSPEDGRRIQRELMAVPAEKRMLAAMSAGAASPPSPAPSPSQSPSPVSTTPNNEKSKPVPRRDGGFGVDDGRTGRGLSSEEAHQL